MGRASPSAEALNEGSILGAGNTRAAANRTGMSADGESWQIARTLDEIEAAADAWLEGTPPFPQTGTAKYFGSETAWPLMTYCRKYLREDAEPDALDVAEAMERLTGRVAFLIEKAEDERGLSTPKAWDQVQALLWLFGKPALEAYHSFADAAERALELRDQLPEKAGAEGP